MSFFSGVNCDVTVIAAVPNFPSLVAVMVAEPAATPVTRPAADTVAAAAFEVVHVTVRPVRTLFDTSRSVAVNCAVCAMARAAVAGVTVTLYTTTDETVTVAVPLFPSLVAVMVAAPTATAVTSPLLDTVATAAPPEVHVTTRPLKTLPLESRVVAVNCCVPPMLSAALDGLTVTVATGIATTVAAEVPLFPSLVAVIVAEPAATPVTRPALDTVATAEFDDVHATVRPVRTRERVSRVVAVNCTVPPCDTVAGAGVTVTV